MYMNSQTLQFSLFYIMMLQRENKNKMCPLQGFKCNWETKFCMEESRWRRRLTLQVSSTAHSGLSTEADTRADFSKAYSSRLLLLQSAAVETPLIFSSLNLKFLHLSRTPLMMFCFIGSLLLLLPFSYEFSCWWRTCFLFTRAHFSDWLSKVGAFKESFIKDN